MRSARHRHAVTSQSTRPLAGWIVVFGATIALAMTAGCSAEPGSTDDLPTTESAEHFGVVAIVRSGGSVPGGADSHVRVTAFFPRHAGTSRSGVVDLLNIPDVPDPALWALEEDQCQLVERNLLAAPPAAEDTGFVDLMDAGELRLQVPEQLDSRIRRRAMPEVFPNVGGITYELDLAEMTPGALTIASTGSRDIGPFSIRLHTPSVPTLIALDGQPLLGHYPSLEWDEDLAVSWARRLPSDPRHARTFVELVGMSFEKSVSIRCRARDNGQTVIPAANLQRLVSIAGPDATIRLVLRRVQHMPLRAQGLELGQAYSVSRDSVLLR